LTYKIINGDIADIGQCRDVIASFIRSELSPFCVNDEYIYRQIEKHKSTSLVAMCNDKVVGIIAGMLVESIVDGSTIMQEIMWYVVNEHRRVGIKLLRAFESMSKEKGAEHIIMVHLANSQEYKISELFLRSGYKTLETQYIKEL
jgi:hypothetical protein